MSREIKFRIWDQLEHKFYEPIHEAYNGRIQEITMTPSGRLIMRELQPDGTYEFYDESMFTDDITREDRFIVSQWTGLTDKNGKEIFEGDKLHILYNGLGVVVVEFKEGAFNVGRIPYNLTRCEIIGHIWEDKNQ